MALPLLDKNSSFRRLPTRSDGGKGYKSQSAAPPSDTPPPPSLRDQAYDALVNALEDAVGRPLTEAEITRFVNPHMSDLTKDLHGDAGAIAGQVSRRVNSTVDKINAATAETKQGQFADEMLAAYREQSATAKDLGERQMQLLEQSQQWTREQLDEFRRVQQEQRNIQGFMFESLGLTPEYDDSGTLVGLSQMSEEDMVARMSPLEREQYEVARLTTERQLKALRGEVDLDPALQNELTQQETQLREALARRLGPSWETTTAGIQALTKFNEAATRVRESARLEVLGQGQGLLTSSLANVNSMVAAKTGPAATIATLPFQPALSQGLANAVAAGSPTVNYGSAMAPSLAVSSTAPNVLSGFGSVLGPIQNRQAMDLQWRMAQLQADPGSPWPALLSTVIGQGVGAVSSYYGAKAGATK